MVKMENLMGSSHTESPLEPYPFPGRQTFHAARWPTTFHAALGTSLGSSSPGPLTPDLSLPQRSNMLVHRPGVIWTSHPRASHPFGTSLDPGGPAWSRWSYTAMSPFPRRATCRTSWDTHEDLLGPLDDLPSPPPGPQLDTERLHTLHAVRRAIGVCVYMYMRMCIHVS